MTAKLLTSVTHFYLIGVKSFIFRDSYLDSWKQIFYLPLLSSA